MMLSLLAFASGFVFDRDDRRSACSALTMLAGAAGESTTLTMLAGSSGASLRRGRDRADLGPAAAEDAARGGGVRFVRFFFLQRTYAPAPARRTDSTIIDRTVS